MTMSHMSNLTRRSFLSTLAISPLVPGLARTAAGDAASPLGLPVIGRIEPRPAKSIAASPLSVGFETLDRRMFDPDRAYDAVGRLGVKWARVQTGWCRCETEPGRYDFAWLDSVVDNLLKRGVQPWFNLGYGNRLYSPEAPDVSAVGFSPLGDAKREAAWVKFVEAMAGHFAGRVKHWEIWNEPNITVFWKPHKPDARQYVRLVAMTAPAIRSKVDGAFLIGGALAGMPRDYLEACMTAGMGKLVDAVSYHPYRPTPEHNYEKDVAAFREILSRHAPHLKLWQGENGAPSGPGSAGALGDKPWNESRQARWVLRRIMIDLKLGVDLTSYFHTVDLVNYNWGSGPSGKANIKGLLRGADYSPKPSYLAYQSLCAMFDAATIPTQFQASVTPAQPIGGDAVHLGRFVRNGRMMLVYWRAADLMTDIAPMPAQVSMTAPGAMALNEPVLVDPLHQHVLRLDARIEGDTWRFTAPLADHPLIITERAAV